MNRIKELRLEKGLTQKDLAEKLKVAQNTLSYWETDKSSPDKDSLIALAEILGCSIDYLLGRDGAVKSDKLEPDIRMISRAAKKMDPEKREKMMRILKITFEEEFKEE